MLKSIFNQKQVLSRQYGFVRCFAANAEIKSKEPEEKSRRRIQIPPEYRFQYQEFLPDPRPRLRNALREKLEREDLLARRTQIHIPEFYVGSIVAVTSSDQHSQSKTNRFVGICIDRDRCGLRSNFILRNVIDHQGVEILFETYDPTIQKIEVLKLEKRLDDKLFYLRDALPEYSTIDLNMEPETLPEGAPVPVNPIKVKLKPRPWLERYERQDLKGVENVDELIYDKQRRRAIERATPWEKYDLMKEYRRSIPEEEQNKIFSDIFTRIKTSNEDHKQKMKAKRSIGKPKQLG